MNLKFSPEDELKSDRLGLRFISEAGHGPRDMIRAVQALRAAGWSLQAGFSDTHPDQGRRIANIQAAIRRRYPDGMPAGMTQ